MTSLYDQTDDVSPQLDSPLLEEYMQYDPESTHKVKSANTSTTADDFDLNNFIHAHDDHSSYEGSDGVERPGCCPPILSFLLMLILSGGGMAASIMAIIQTLQQRGGQDYRTIIVCVMCAICLMNCVHLAWKGLRLRVLAPASRREIAHLKRVRARLNAEFLTLTEKTELMRADARRLNTVERQLMLLVEGQGVGMPEIIGLARENEEILEEMRENIRRTVSVDVLNVLTSNIGETEIIDDAKAQLLASEISARLAMSSVSIDVSKFQHLLAANPTLLGSVEVVRKLVRPGQSVQGVYDMYSLPVDQARGSVHAARARTAGRSVISLTPRSLRTPSRRSVDDRAKETATGPGAYGPFESKTSPLGDDDDPDRMIPRDRARIKQQLRQFWIMASPFFRETRQAKIMTLILLILLFANSGIKIFFSFLMRDFYTALVKKDAKTFYTILYKFMLSMIVLIPVQVLYKFVRVKFGISWRKWLTQRVLDMYFSNKVYYGLEQQSKSADDTAREYKDRKKDMDNPDQRIQEDVDSFTSYSLSFFLTIIDTILDLCSFSGILFTIMPKLFIAIFIFASVGTLCTVLVGKVLIKLNYESLQREADFRFSLVRIRENAESIAFYKGEGVENREIAGKFKRVISNMTARNWATSRLQVFTNIYNHFTNILPLVILANEYFDGLIEYGVIAQARSAFWHILDDFSLIINEFNGISNFLAGIDRLFFFMKAIQELDQGRNKNDSNVMKPYDDSDPFMPPSDNQIVLREYDPFITLSQHPSAFLEMRNVHLSTPDGKRTLVQHLNLSLMKGNNLLIAGVSGAGKSSLLRAIAGLWNTGSGEIARPRSEDIYFLPQLPYCPPGTLRDQLLYPSTELYDEFDSSRGGPLRGSPNDVANISDEELLNILSAVDLPDLAARAGDGNPMAGISAVQNWSNTLSLGEQQRLAFGRLIVNRPKFVVMDESTSALDVVAERKMYDMMRDYGFVYVSVGHRPTLLQFHEVKLLLKDCSGLASFIPRTDSSRQDEAILQSAVR